MALPAVTGVYGIRVEGRDAAIIFPTVADALGGAHRLIEHGYLRVEIFERTSGSVITRLNGGDIAA